MAAGLGFKTFTTGEVLTAGDVNGYLMQGINVFASSAARAAAITSPQEGQYSFLKDTNALEYYDGAAWVGAPVGDITAVTAGTGISGGGSSGDVTITNSMATAIDAKGDLIAGTGADAFSRLAVGANDTVLTADSTAATGLKWATPAAGGMTQLATGSLTGTSVSITGLSTAYNELYIVFNAVSLSGADQPNFRFNADNGANYFQGQNGFNGGVGNSGSNSGVLIGTNVLAANTAGVWIIQIPNYATTTGYKTGFWTTTFLDSGATFRNVAGSFAYASVTAITSVQFFASYGGSSTFDNGTYTIYGVK